MSTESPLNSMQGQFDDALEDVQQHDPRQGGHFIDDRLLQWSESSDDEDEDIDELSGDDFEGHKAEDEDWEFAERGESTCNHRSVLMYNQDVQILPNSTIAFVSTSLYAVGMPKGSLPLSIKTLP
jgi:hypothetical protein